jgi:RNA polymerase sigma factor (sigma-70 family)
VTEPVDSADIGDPNAAPSVRDSNDTHTAAWCGHCHKLYDPGLQEAPCLTCGAAATAWDTDALYRALAPGLVRYVRSLLRTWNVSDARVDAEGAVNEAFLTMIKQTRAWDTTIDDPAAWLFVVARRKAAQAVRKERRIDDGDRQDPAEVHSSARWSSMPPRPSAHDIRGFRLAMRAIADLPDRQKVATYLQTVEGWTLEEIGKYLDCAASTAGVHVHRGKVRVREHLDMHWASAPPPAPAPPPPPPLSTGARITYYHRRMGRRAFVSLAMGAMIIAMQFVPAFWQLVLAAGVVGVPVVTVAGAALWDALQRRRARRVRTRFTTRRDPG